MKTSELPISRSDKIDEVVAITRGNLELWLRQHILTPDEDSEVHVLVKIFDPTNHEPENRLAFFTVIDPY